MAVALFAAAALAACGGPHSGTVAEKYRGEPYDWSYVQCVSYGKSGCAVWMPVIVHEPERWYLTVRAEEEYGQCSVDKSLWDAKQIGDQIKDCT